MNRATESDWLSGNPSNAALSAMVRDLRDDVEILRVCLHEQSQREARRDKPSQPQPGAGVETAEAFVSRINFYYKPERIKSIEARDASLTAAARAKAIEDCVAIAERQAAYSIASALRTLKEQG
jgi:hypothetical protein